MEETVSELQEALRTASEAGASGNEARLQKEIETLKVIIVYKVIKVDLYTIGLVLIARI